MRPRTLRETVALARRVPWGDDDVISSRVEADTTPLLPSLPSPPVKRGTPLRQDWVVDRLPRDMLMMICSPRCLDPTPQVRACPATADYRSDVRALPIAVFHLPSTADLARCDAVCRAFHSTCGCRRSVIADALAIRACDLAATATTTSTAQLLRDEVLRTLAASLKTEWEGMPLLLSVETNTGYEGVTVRPWQKPFAYKAVVDGYSLGSFPTAVSAATAVAQFRYVESHPYL